MTPREKEISLEELMALPIQFLGSPARSSDKIAFVSNKSGRTELHLLDLQTRRFTQLTHGEYPLNPLGWHKWAPDDSYLLFMRDPVQGNEKNDIYKVSVPDGKVTQLTNTPNSRDDVAEISHDGRYVVFASDRAGGITQIFRMNPDGSSVIKLTDHTRPASDWQEPTISPDDEWIAYSANESDDLKNQDIWIVKMDGSERKKLFGVRDGSIEIPFAWSSDGSKLLIGSDHAESEQAGVYFLDSGEVRWFGSARSPETPVRFTSDNRRIIVTRSIDAEERILLYDIESGNEEALKLPPGVTGTRYTTHDGQHLLIGNLDSIHRMRFILYNLQKHTYEEIIPPEYGRYTPDDFHPDEYISYPSGEVIIHAILYKPKSIEHRAKLPAIVIAHGGPTSHYIRDFFEDAQVMTSKGYVVLLPNVRGSTGYGVEFRDSCLNDWGGKDLDDIAAGVAYLRSLDYVDSERIGIHGGSYGGFMTYMAVTKRPDLWKAASAWMGITSLKHQYDKCLKTYPSLSYWLEEQMGKPDNELVLKLWENRSAVNFAENLKAKLQIIHGENDPRCPIEQAELFRNRLLELGRKEGEDFEYILLSDEGHGSTDAKQRIRMMRAVLDFFDRNL